ARSEDFRAQPFAHWECPERILINVHALYRQFRGQSGPMRPLERLQVLRQTALLAREFPGAAPACLHPPEKN
ncbi:MAG: hypothetical protein JO112_01730, partial [Planctomycetes bacterium]|nr:hypothetical protein [Planctomycetota bacterium]